MIASILRAWVFKNADRLCKVLNADAESPHFQREKAIIALSRSQAS
jgi:hypothetical protein